ncbi:MAG: hypothetical protein KGH54_02555 [Candidatus Micrarchaeota archaeon]|nr:hypothetical protein [Candidatus Micrarchaeota archaeon]
MDTFVRNIALLVKEKKISVDEGTKITNDYWKLRDAATEINRRLETSDDKQERRELVKALEQKNEQIKGLARSLHEELAPSIRKG